MISLMKWENLIRNINLKPKILRTFTKMSLVKVVFKYLCDCPKHSAYLFASLGGLACIEFITTILLSKPEINNFLSLFCFLYLVDILWSRNVLEGIILVEPLLLYIFHRKKFFHEKILLHQTYHSNIWYNMFLNIWRLIFDQIHHF